MTRDDIIKLAREADVWIVGQEPYQTQLERFAALVADRDEALMRQCLEALEPWAGLSHTNLIAALRERLEGKA